MDEGLEATRKKLNSIKSKYVVGHDPYDSRIFDSGAKRDSNEGKIRPDLISPLMLKALGRVMAEGARHYGEKNWERGIPNNVLKESASRHYVSWMNDEIDEDHAAKLIFNVMAWIHFRDKQIDNDRKEGA